MSRVQAVLIFCLHCDQFTMHDVRFNHVGMAREKACHVCQRASVPNAQQKEYIRQQTQP